MPKILVIDDSDVMRDLLTEFLTDEGFEVDSTDDGINGVAMALEGEYDICVCDMHLPTRNGYDVFCEVTAKKPQLLFVITDSLPDHQSDKVRKAGAYRYLRKPFELEQLREIIQGIYNRVKS